jgi:hypothetical protein
MGKPKRHGCLLTWLILMLCADVLTIVFKFAAPVLDAAVQKAVSNADSPLHGMDIHSTPAWVNYATIALALVDIVAVVAIFQWKRWAFYASVAVSALLITVNLAGGASVMDVVTMLVSPVLLYATLQIGGPNKGWTQLK